MIKEFEPQRQISIWEEFPKLKDIPTERFPNHAWITPDGNGRYAESLGMPILFGHQQGFRTIERVLRRMRELPIKYVTVWGLSSDNVVTRKPEELKGIMDVMQFAIQSNLDDLLKNNVKFQCIGRRDRISPELVETIVNAERRTESNNGQVLTLAIDFNGESEQLAIMQELLNQQHPLGTEATPQLRNDLLKAYRKGLPPVNLVIRTVEPDEKDIVRRSNIGDIAEQALHFNIPKLLPATNIEDFIDVIIKYANAPTQRFGGRPEQEKSDSNEILGLPTFKESFDAYLTDYILQKIAQLKKLTSDETILDYVDHAIKIVTSEQGKRLRPYVSYLMYSVLGGDNPQKALKTLVALELFHAFSLVHDDIIDIESTRRGIETTHLYIANKIQKRSLNVDHTHIGESHAIVVGDLINNWSQELLDTTTDFPETILRRARACFRAMGDEVALGQMIDIDITAREAVTQDLQDEKTRLKTASYTFVWPMLIGATLANQDTIAIKTFCKEFGQRLGLVFQAQDDLFDSEADIQSAQGIIERNLKEAKLLINDLQLSEERKRALRTFVETVETRTY